MLFKSFLSAFNLAYLLFSHTSVQHSERLEGIQLQYDCVGSDRDFATVAITQMVQIADAAQSAVLSAYEHISVFHGNPWTYFMATHNFDDAEEQRDTYELLENVIRVGTRRGPLIRLFCNDGNTPDTRKCPSANPDEGVLTVARNTREPGMSQREPRSSDSSIGDILLCPVARQVDTNMRPCNRGSPHLSSPLHTRTQYAGNYTIGMILLNHVLLLLHPTFSSMAMAPRDCHDLLIDSRADGGWESLINSWSYVWMAYWAFCLAYKTPLNMPYTDICLWNFEPWDPHPLMR
ncbi:MAG: hypothetical protein M1833_004236 [Piccolia ochrophora]|nr:MAG: hypothetical protein M1833_004236 [Piccolia ochrophora]